MNRKAAGQGRTRNRAAGTSRGDTPETRHSRVGAAYENTAGTLDSAAQNRAAGASRNTRRDQIQAAMNRKAAGQGRTRNRTAGTSQGGNGIHAAAGWGRPRRDARQEPRRNPATGASQNK
jgi:hypothetical protein